jgi:hypothetical protein
MCKVARRDPAVFIGFLSIVLFHTATVNERTCGFVDVEALVVARIPSIA